MVVNGKLELMYILILENNKFRKMKNLKFLYSKIILLSILFFVMTVSCDREFSDEVEFAKFPSIAEVFTDAPVAMGSNFYFPYGGSKATAWSVDNEVSYKGLASMRFDVPNADDPDGNYAGAIFRIYGEGSGRDLSGFDALTFWAKATQAVTIAQIGFGEDFGENKYMVTNTDLSLTTNWVKYVIPIPDASKLIQERGMLRYAAGSQNTGGLGYTFWIDELKFEKLGTVAQLQPAIFNGEDVIEQSFIGNKIDVKRSGLASTFNVNGRSVTVYSTPSYFTFRSSDPGVASVDENGIVEVRNSGTATITAEIAGVKANGSLTVESTGSFDTAPIPDRDPANVISIFSDAYTNVPVDYYNGFFAPYQTTQGGAPPIDFNGDMIINYTDLNFVGIGTFFNVSPINITSMNYLHIDIRVNEAIDPNDFINIQLINSVGNNETSGTVPFGASTFIQNQWVSLDIPISSFGLVDRTKIGLLFFISDATISNIYVDNIYYYK